MPKNEAVTGSTWLQIQILLKPWQRLHDLHRLHAHADYLAHEADDVFGVGFAVGVAHDATAFVFAHLVLVDHSIERAAVAAALDRHFGHQHPAVRAGRFAQELLKGGFRGPFMRDLSRAVVVQRAVVRLDRLVIRLGGGGGRHRAAQFGNGCLDRDVTHHSGYSVATAGFIPAER